MSRLWSSSTGTPIAIAARRPLTTTSGELANGGVETGFKDFDTLTGGLHESELIILAARPSMGKTAFSINIAENVALDSSKPVAIFSMEMGGAQLVMRMIGSIGRLNQHALRTGKFRLQGQRRLELAHGGLIVLGQRMGVAEIEVHFRLLRVLAEGFQKAFRRRCPLP